LRFISGNPRREFLESIIRLLESFFLERKLTLKIGDLSRESVSLSGIFFGETTLLFFVYANIVDFDFLAECIEYFIFNFMPCVRGVGLFFLEFGDFGVDLFGLGFEVDEFLVAMF